MEARRRGGYASIAEIPRDKDGFPVVGLVVRHFRNKKGWTQVQLAHKLGVKELMVRMMETKNQGLDSMERRRLLCRLLGIPPILLGLGSLEQLERILQPDNTAAKAAPTILHESSTPTIGTYTNLLVAYNQTNITQSGAPLINDVETIVPALYQQIRNTASRQAKRELLYVAWEFHRLGAKVHADYKRNMVATMHHLDKALIIALELSDANLLAITHEHIANIRLLEGPHVARVDIDAALQHVKQASPVVQSEVYALASRIYHTSMIDAGDSAKSKYFLERSLEALPTSNFDDIRHIPMGLTVVRCQLSQIDSFVASKQASNALDIIEDIESITPSGYERREAHLSIDRASCFLLLDQPQYALDLLTHAATLSKQLQDKDKMRQIRNMYQQLKAGPYKNNRAVMDFEERLLNL